MISAPDHAIDHAIDDAQLARRMQAGDALAFELVMRRNNRRLFRVARAMLRNDADAEDAVQDAYLSAFRGIRGWRGECALSTWLTRVVANACYGRLRRQARRDNVVAIVATDEVPEPEMEMRPADAPDLALARSEIRALLERRLDALPEAYRLVFMLRCVEELSVEETAACLDIPEATVRTRQFRARAMLREALAQDFDLAERDVFAFGGARCDRIVAGVLAELASN